MPVGRGITVIKRIAVNDEHVIAQYNVNEHTFYKFQTVVSTSFKLLCWAAKFNYTAIVFDMCFNNRSSLRTFINVLSIKSMNWNWAIFHSWHVNTNNGLHEVVRLGAFLNMYFCVITGDYRGNSRSNAIIDCSNPKKSQKSRRFHFGTWRKYRLKDNLNIHHKQMTSLS